LVIEIFDKVIMLFLYEEIDNCQTVYIKRVDYIIMGLLRKLSKILAILGGARLFEGCEWMLRLREGIIQAIELTYRHRLGL